jgi:transcriptional regulator with XRE-family HTH domain
MDNKNVFANNLKKQMELKDVSRKDLSETLGISYFTITAWVNGTKYPRMDKVEMLANYFGIQKSDLIEDKTAEEKEIPGEAMRLTEDEKMLLNLFRQIPEDQQKVFLEMGRVYANSLKKD